MIISHKYKYLFVELPRTGSTAISKELVLHYGGEEILKKHATYKDFAANATAAERNFFTFSAIRNPVDKILSLYFKYKTNQRNYDDPATYLGSSIFVTWLMKSQFKFVQKGDVSFSEFFKRYYFLPYDDWSSLDHKNLNFVVRFENLTEDFAVVLNNMGIEPVRPLPVINKTEERIRDFWSYFEPDIQGRAQWVFGPYFRRWGYEFPDSWKITEFRSGKFVLNLANVFRIFYWRKLR